MLYIVFHGINGKEISVNIPTKIIYCIILIKYQLQN